MKGDFDTTSVKPDNGGERMGKGGMDASWKEGRIGGRGEDICYTNKGGNVTYFATERAHRETHTPTHNSFALLSHTKHTEVVLQSAAGAPLLCAHLHLNAFSTYDGSAVPNFFLMRLFRSSFPRHTSHLGFRPSNFSYCALARALILQTH